MPPLKARLALLLGISSLLVGCESNVTLVLQVDPPVENLLSAEIGIAGVDFETSSGGVTSVEFDEVDFVDLVDLADGGRYLLIEKSAIGEGDYTGVRLRYDVEDGDDTARVVLADGDELELEISSSNAFAPVDFSLVDEDEAALELTLAIDLRLSLRDEDTDDDNNAYVLEPVSRAQEDQYGASISGDVSSSRVNDCDVSGEAEGYGVAIYLFEGEDVSPDDYDEVDADPIATTPVVLGSAGYQYSIDVLEAGDYTVALVCDAHLENPAIDNDADGEDALDFRDEANVSLDEEEAATVDFD